jgi:hypothetical protein
VSKVVESLFGYGYTSTQIKKSSENEIFFKNDFIPKDIRILEHNCMLLWMTIVYGSERTCAKPSSLGCSQDCF